MTYSTAGVSAMVTYSDGETPDPVTYVDLDGNILRAFERGQDNGGVTVLVDPAHPTKPTQVTAHK